MEQKPSISWSALPYQFKPKSIDWYWAMGIIVIAGSIASFFYSNFLFGIFILISGSLVIFTAHKEPNITDFEINEKGISINEEYILWKNILNYNIVTRKDERLLLISRNVGINRIVSFPIININEEELIKVIESYTKKEDTLIESIAERLFDYFGI